MKYIFGLSWKQNLIILLVTSGMLSYAMNIMVTGQDRMLTSIVNVEKSNYEELKYNSYISNKRKQMEIIQNEVSFYLSKEESLKFFNHYIDIVKYLDNTLVKNKKEMPKHFNGYYFKTSDIENHRKVTIGKIEYAYSRLFLFLNPLIILLILNQIKLLEIRLIKSRKISKLIDDKKITEEQFYHIFHATMLAIFTIVLFEFI